MATNGPNTARTNSCSTLRASRGSIPALRRWNTEEKLHWSILDRKTRYETAAASAWLLLLAAEGAAESRTAFARPPTTAGTALVFFVAADADDAPAIVRLAAVVPVPTVALRAAEAAADAEDDRATNGNIPVITQGSTQQ
jgi:hypothetical protein